MIKEWPTSAYPFKCRKCGRRFLTPRARQKHEEKKHGGKK